jgi:hypothetical protein
LLPFFSVKIKFGLENELNIPALQANQMKTLRYLDHFDSIDKCYERLSLSGIYMGKISADICAENCTSSNILISNLFFII